MSEDCGRGVNIRTTTCPKTVVGGKHQDHHMSKDCGRGVNIRATTCRKTVVEV